LNSSSTNSPQHNKRNDKSDDYDGAAHEYLPDAHKPRWTPKVSAHQRAGGHQKASGQDTRCESAKPMIATAVDADAQEILDAVGAVNVMQTKQAQRREYHDAVAGSEVAAVDAEKN